MKLVAIISSLLLILGAFFPWIQLETILINRGIDNSDGAIALVFGVIALVLLIYELIKNENKFYFIYLFISLLFLIISSYNIVQAYNRTIQVNNIISIENFKSYIGAGLYIILLGSIGLFTYSVYQIRRLNIQTGFFSKKQGIVSGFIANRIAFNPSKGSGGQKSFSRFIIRLSTVATIISVAVMIITLAFANGFQETVSQKIFAFWGHIRVQEKQPDKAIISEETPIIKNDLLIKIIAQNPEVQSIYPFATKYAILKTKDEIEGVLLKGFDSTYNFSHLQPFIKEGRPIQFNDSTYSREIMISTNTASRLNLKVNDKILIYFIRPDGKIRPDKLLISGIYKTGIEEYDKTFAIGDLNLIQRLNDWDKDEVGGYEIFLNDYKKIDQTVNEIYNLDAFPLTWNTISVRNISPNIFDWLNMQDVTRNVLIGFMIIVALINLITCLIILVLERVRMIGILKSLGATDWTVQKIFLRHSLIIALTGIIAGALFALGFLWLQSATGFIRLPEDAYYVDRAAVKIVWWQVVAICGGTLLICFLVMMVPSLLVRKIQPVKAIQFR